MVATTPVCIPAIAAQPKVAGAGMRVLRDGGSAGAPGLPSCEEEEEVGEQLRASDVSVGGAEARE